ncbi:hypothetical protein R3W88_032010 [Solanum pinnatisectum]|uniref:Sulfotransferase n=1 Tax=Solanum pinnatisectum TaxID=50273 RepID=A0AAV9LNZ2_9SOLN|nr:hypothetical protein R3W88_032010 [Solanum pinnatisectum]
MTTSPPKYLQEDNLSEECKKLLSILPKEKGWVGSYVCNYQGCWTPPKFLQGVIFFQQQFQAQDSDIYHSLRHPIFEPNHPLLVQNSHVLVPFLEHTLYIDGRVPNFLTFTSPRLLATHVPFASLPKSVQDSKTKLVYLCRNPRDTFISMWHFANNLIVHHKDTNSIEEMFYLFCEGAILYGPILGMSLFHRGRNSGVVDEILQMCSIENLSNLMVNTNGKFSTGEEYKLFFRRGEIGDWKNYFTKEMSDKLNHIIEEKFQGSGLKFSYV